MVPSIFFSSFRIIALLRLGGNQLRSATHFFTPVLRRTSVMMAPRFIPSRLDAIENIEDYQPGGYHPISVGDTFVHGRFRAFINSDSEAPLLFWLARDQSRIVTLKAMRADVPSSKVPNEIPELAISQKLRASLPPSESVDFQTVDHHFFVQGPNGSHLFLIFPLSGPSILAMSDSPGRTAGSRQLRADLARKVAKQTAMMMHHMHCTGVVHGGKQSSASFSTMSVAGE